MSKNSNLDGAGTQSLPAYVRKTLEDVSKEIAVRREELTVLSSEVNQLEITRSSLLELYDQTSSGLNAAGAAEAASGRTEGKEAEHSTSNIQPSTPNQAAGRKGAAVKPARSCKGARSAQEAAQLAREILAGPSAGAEEPAAAPEKPQTLAPAMKFLARKTSKPFTLGNMFEALRADGDFARLLADGAPNRVYGNLAYWVKTGKLTRSGEGEGALYTVVAL